LRLSPFDPFGYLSAADMAFAHLAARRFEEAIEWADRALHKQPRFIVAIRAKIVANAHLGRLDEARADLGRMPAIDSKLTIAEWRAFAAPLFALEFLELYVTGQLDAQRVCGGKRLDQPCRNRLLRSRTPVIFVQFTSKRSAPAGGTEGSNLASSSSQSVSPVNPEAIGEKPRTLAAVCGWLGT
jgi:tetratricopeptide (TPR) repeat protein